MLIPLIGHAQLIFENSYAFVGGSFGLYSPNADDFEVVYKDNKHLPSVIAGIGYSNFALIGKYKQFKTSGTSKVKNISAKGVADWNQEFYLMGIRIFNSNPVYFDICLVETKLTEKIGTKNPKLVELASEITINDRGLSLTVGGCLPIYQKKIYLTGDVDFMYIEHRYQKDDGDYSGLSLGGYSFNIGLIFGLEY